MSPNTFPRRVLLLVTGLNPQIVTETLYALVCSESSAFMPTEVRLITTSQGARKAQELLLNQGDGWFYRFCHDYGVSCVDFSADHICVLEDDSGPMDDIRSCDNNQKAADLITQAVRELSSDPDCAIHASIAGGRKTMGFYLGYALSLFGREQDRLSHVLVSEPFESHPDFFYPDKTARFIHTRPPESISVNTQDARVELADIPLVKLRCFLPDNALDNVVSFASTVSSINHYSSAPRICLDFSTQTLEVDGQTVILSPRPSLFAFYAWLAIRRKTAPAESYVNYRDTFAADEYFDVYVQCFGGEPPNYERVKASLKDGFDTNFLAEKSSRVKRQLLKQLGPRASKLLVDSKVIGRQTCYGLVLDPDQIEIVYD